MAEFSVPILAEGVLGDPALFEAARAEWAEFWRLNPYFQRRERTTPEGLGKVPLLAKVRHLPATVALRGALVDAHPPLFCETLAPSDRLTTNHYRHGRANLIAHTDSAIGPTAIIQANETPGDLRILASETHGPRTIKFREVGQYVILANGTTKASRPSHASGETEMGRMSVGFSSWADATGLPLELAQQFDTLYQG